MMLDPDHRILLTQAFRAPAGYQFDSGIATTYSLDLTTLLGATLHLSLFGDEASTEELNNGIALLEALRRTSERLTVYCQTGQIYVPKMAHVLYALLEPVVVPVKAPLGGVFHPKLWVLRFVPVSNGLPAFFRLLVLSRNLTFDRCWDAALALTGSPAGRGRRQNDGLRDLLVTLPSLATKVSESRRRQAESIAEEIHTVEWRMPDGFDDVEFEVLGLRRKRWTPRPSQRLAVISPYCSVEGLRALAESTSEPVALISRPDELDKLDGGTHKLFRQVLVLREAAESDDGDDTSTATTALRGLHAKLFVSERGSETSIVAGSANATKAALVDCANVEILASLTGRRSRVKGIDELLSPEGLGNVLEEYAPGTLPEEDKAVIEAQERLEEARMALCESALHLTCEGEGDRWELTLRARTPVPLPGISKIKVWPISLQEELGADAAAIQQGLPVRFPACSLAAVTGFLAFELTAEAAQETCRFVLNLPVEGLPEDRRSAVVRTIVANREGFLKYLLFLLADLEEDGLPNEILREVSGEESSWGPALQDALPLLEEMTRALSRDPAKLRSIKSLIEDLTKTDGGRQLVPEAFLDLWRAYEEMIEESER